jgi:hypothetical protein
MASALPCPHEAVIVRYEDGKERKITIAYNALPVKLPKHAYPLFLVVAKGFGDASHELPGKNKDKRGHMAHH